MIVFQSAVIFAVVASNIAYEWTPNRLIPALFGVGLAFLLTVCWNWLLDTRQRLHRARGE